MRILYFYRVPLPSPRADAIQIVQTCAAMARSGARVDLHVEESGGRDARAILDYYGAGPPDSPGAGGLSVVSLGSHWSWPFLTLRTTRILGEAAGKPGCLFVREVRPYVPGLMDRARRAGLKLIFEAHNVSASLAKEKEAGAGGIGERSMRREALEKSILGRADALVCTQRATLEDLGPSLRDGIPRVVLGNAARPPLLAPGRARDIDILYCGSLKAWKGVDTLVAAMQGLHPFVLTIVGPGTDQDIARVKEIARALGVRERVRLLPPVSPAEVWDFYARARVGVIPLPSGGSVEAQRFTSPLKLFEMMAAGLPIVASRLPSLGEYLENDRESLLVPPDDPRFLAYAVKRVLTEEGLGERLASAGRTRAGEFTWEERGRRIVELARGLCGAAPAA